MRLALHLVRGLLTSAFRFPRWSLAERRGAIKTWSARLLDVLALRLHVSGRPCDVPLMLIANHVSWLDIFAINAVLPARFVAKSEIRGWPFLGWLCEQAGTIFIRQSRRQDTLRVNVAVTAALAAGDVFAVFPEGTTTDGTRLLKFHSSLMEPALGARAVVQPVAVRYLRTDRTSCTEVSYEGDNSLWDTVLAMTTQRAIEVHVAFLPPLVSEGRHRRELAREAEDVIRRALYPPAPGNRVETAADRRA